MTEPHCETALKHIQHVVALVSTDNPPITVAEAMEQIVETLDLAGFAPVAGAGVAAGAQGASPQ